MSAKADDRFHCGWCDKTFGVGGGSLRWVQYGKSRHAKTEHVFQCKACKEKYG